MGIKKNERYKVKSVKDQWAITDENKVWVDKFNKLSRIMGDYSAYETSDGITLNLLEWRPNIAKKIRHLPTYEQSYILFKHDRLTRLKIQLGAFKKNLIKSYGKNCEIPLEMRKAQIFEWYAMSYSTEEIHKLLSEESGVNVSFSSLRRFYLRYKVEIEKIQNEYDNVIGAIGISRKRSRLEVLDYMLRKTKQEYDRENGDRMLPFGREMQKILEQARKEVEGEQIRLNIDGTINITATLESAKATELLYSDINFMNLLIARVAARMNINPFLLQWQLTNSWYSKFTGIKRNNSIMDEIPNYPSKIILNWNDLQDKAEKKQKEYDDFKDRFTQEVNSEPVKEDKDKSDKLRSILKDRIKQKQDDIDKIKVRIKEGNMNMKKNE
jgi:hypothetical protein